MVLFIHSTIHSLPNKMSSAWAVGAKYGSGAVKNGGVEAVRWAPGLKTTKEWRSLGSTPLYVGCRFLLLLLLHLLILMFYARVTAGTLLIDRARHEQAA